MVWWDPKHQEPKAAFLSFHPSVCLVCLFCLHSPLSMSQSSKCDEHHRLHNAKSPSLIDDTVNTSTHIHWHARTHRLSHTHSRTRALACKKNQKPLLSWHIHPQAEEPPSCHTALLQAQDPRCFVLTHSAYTHSSLVLPLSLQLSLSLTHTH